MPPLRSRPSCGPPAALTRLAEAFDLSAFEIRAAMLCLGYELAPDIAGAVALLSGEARPAGIPIGLPTDMPKAWFVALASLSKAATPRRLKENAARPTPAILPRDKRKEGV